MNNEETKINISNNAGIDPYYDTEQIIDEAKAHLQVSLLC